MRLPPYFLSIARFLVVRNFNIYETQTFCNIESPPIHLSVREKVVILSLF